MPRINLSQYQFVLSDPWQAGHVMTGLEASALNYYRSDLIRKIAIRWVQDMELRSTDGVLSIEDLDMLERDVADLDNQYQMPTRPEPKTPAFNHVLQQVAAQLGLSVNDPAVKREARKQLINSFKTIYGDSND